MGNGWKVGVAYERYGYVEVSSEEAKTEEEAFKVAKKKVDDMDVHKLEEITEPLLPETLEVDEKGVLRI